MDWLLNLQALTMISVVVIIVSYSTIYWYVRVPGESVRIGLVRTTAWIVLHLYHRLRIDRRDPLPKKGAAIVIANHRSGIDPVALSVATCRRIHFLMAREYYETVGLRWLFRDLECIPVNRDGNDWGALKTALRYLKQGRVIGIFPQGGIRGPEEILDEGKGGVALMAAKTQTSLYPFFIAGSPHYDSMLRCFLTPSRTRITCGEPFRLNPVRDQKLSRAEQAELTQQVLYSIAKLAENDFDTCQTGSTTSRRNPT